MRKNNCKKSFEKSNDLRKKSLEKRDLEKSVYTLFLCIPVMTFENFVSTIELFLLIGSNVPALFL